MTCPYVKWIFSLAILLSGASCMQHRFERQPYNTTVRIGDTASLRCAIQNQQTRVQWTMDGFGLGYKFWDPRLSFAGDESLGEFNLRITNVQLSDDGEYVCQVDPDSEKDLVPLKSRSAYLDVIVPPKEINLEPMVSGAIDVKYPGRVTVTCTVPDTKPASEISWKLRGVDYEGVTSKKLATGSKPKLITTSSSIYLQPTKEENGTSVECVVTHKAMDSPVSRVATLNVLYPPNPPKISGFRARPMQSGEELRVNCKVAGGNPLAKITWLIGEEVVQRNYQHRGQTTQSLLSHKLRPKDNGKVLTCQAESPALDEPLEDQVQLEVYYPPENIIIERNPEEGTQENGVLTFTCQYPESNPLASLAWYIGNVKLPLQWSDDVGSIPYMIRTLRSEDYAARIELTLTSVRREDADLTIKCRASIPEIDYVHEVTTHPKVNYAPRKVEVSVVPAVTTPVTIPVDNEDGAATTGDHHGASNGQLAYKAGDIVLLQCVAKGGSPPPNLVWYINGRPVTAGERTAISAPEVKVQNERNGRDTVYGEFITASTMELTLQASHNEASVSCVARHDRYSETLTDSRTLKVAFPPESLSVEQFPSLLIAGNPMSLTCKTSPSNPVARITWYKDNVKLPSHFFVTLPATVGRFGGFISSSRLQITPTPNDDGGSFTCKAEIGVLQETITQQYKLQVEYPPVFYPTNRNKTSFNTTEGDNFIEIKVVAHAKPQQMSFSWFRIVPMKNSVDGSTILAKNPLTKGRRFVWNEDNGLLRINQLKREDGGIYMVRATNSRGTADLNITLNVFYPSKIDRISGPSSTLTEGQSTKLRCDFRSHPLSPTKVTWVKEAPGSGRSSYAVETFADHSVLTLDSLTADDRGSYKCVVDNNVGDVDSRIINLHLIHTPTFADTTPSKVAVSSMGSDGKLYPNAIIPCVVHSTPAATIIWARGNKTINAADDEKYSVLQEVIDSETTRSSLQINKIPLDGVKEDDSALAEFFCKASNQQGQNIQKIQVVLQGPPDAPTGIKIYNVTATSVHLTWKRGFDGGARQRFIVQYKENTKGAFNGEYEAITSQTNSRTIPNLVPHKEYIFRVIAKNDYGESAASEVVRTKTAPSMQQNTSGAIFGIKKGYVVAIGVVFVIVFIVSVVVAVMTFRRCKISKQTYKPKTIETDCESLTHAASSLSSRGSSAKRPECERLVGDPRQENRRVSNIESESDRQLLQGELEEIPIPHDTFEQGQSCYFDCSASGCSSHHSADHSDDPGCGPNACAFSSFKSGVSTMPNSSRLGRFSLGSRSARANRQPVTEERIARNCSEPRFRFDVVPTEDCLANLHDNSFDRQLDLPLPPPLPPYEHRSYPKRPSAGSNCDIRSASSYAGQQNVNGSRGNFRQYHTLEPTKFPFEPCYDGCSGGVQEGRTSFGRSNSVKHHPDTCLYNLVSRPTENTGYAMSSISMPSNEAYVTDVNAARVRGSQSSASSTGSGLYVKSLDNMMNFPDSAQQRASIVNDDGSINTFGFDFPPPPLDIIRESQSQDPLPGAPRSEEDYSTHRPSAFTSPSAANEGFSRKSSLKGTASTTLPSKRGVAAPSVRFRDELSKALNNPRPQDLRLNIPQHHSEHSDDDADSGCGGSADVAVHSDPSPVSPARGQNSAFSPVSSVSENEGMVLRV